MPGQENTESKAEIPIDVISRAAYQAIKDPVLWINIARKLYQYLFTDRAPFSQGDRKRYAKMLHLYSVCTGAAGSDKIPREWEVDNQHCPLYSSDFETRGDTLKTELESLAPSQANMKLQIIGIVANIARLYESIGKRTIARQALNLFTSAQYRSDGFESMFLTEMAMWAAIELPRYSVADSATADMVQKRMEYCDAMQKGVLIYRSDRDIPNVKDILKPIIAEMKAMHENLCDAYKSATFKDRIQLIDAYSGRKI